MPKRLIPTMFHRRILLLLGLVTIAAGALGAQLSVLTIARAPRLRAAAEARLERVEWLPTIRGRILDRKRRALAQDRPSFDLAVHYSVISGTWAEERAGDRARRLHRALWRELDQDERSGLVERYAAIYREHLDRAWSLVASTAGLEREDVEERRQAVVRRIEALSDSVVLTRERREVAAVLSRGEQITTEVEDEIDRRASAEIRETTMPQVLIPRVSDRVGFEFMRLATERTDLIGPDSTTLEEDVPLVPGLEVVNASDREYPFDSISVRIDRSAFPSPIANAQPAEVTVRGVLIHVLGWMGRNATEADEGGREPSPFVLAGREYDRGRYENGDSVGRFGIESGREQQLRGLRGLRVRRFDTGEQREIAPQPGQDQQLTIDAHLQARVQALLEPGLGLAAVQEWHALPRTYPNGSEVPGTSIGTPLHGAAVVLDVESGDILAMVSAPGFTRDMLRSQPDQVFDDPFRPWINRAVSASYPPGSIAKAIVLATAVTLGRHSLSVPIECNGHLLPNDPNSLRCWIFKRSQTGETPMTHTRLIGHALDAREALMMSCNIYFFTLGRQLGAQGIRRTYEMFGVGQAWNLGLSPAGRRDEFAGSIGLTRDGPDGTRVPVPLDVGDAVQMGIGQGPIAWTPLHAADALATLARGGVRIKPRVLKSEPPTRTDLGLDRAAVEAALEGLSLSVNDSRGTGHHLTLAPGVTEPIFNVPGVHVWGKTGTADAPKLEDDPDGPGGEKGRTIRDGDHSWFVVLVGPEGGKPKYAIAVLMEYAGSGGKVSGPICNQIIRALVTEGYL